jgi:alcohol dehydrogenase YqhD (iron-dependent ADH family)
MIYNSTFNSNLVTSGGSASSSTKERLLNKGILITVILCATLASIIAVLGATTCYLYIKDQFPHGQLNACVHTFDKYASWSSHSNLISHHSSSLSSSVVKTGFVNRFKSW